MAQIFFIQALVLLRILPLLMYSNSENLMLELCVWVFITTLAP